MGIRLKRDKLVLTKVGMRGYKKERSSFLPHLAVVVESMGSYGRNDNKAGWMVGGNEGRTLSKTEASLACTKVHPPEGETLPVEKDQG